MKNLRRFAFHIKICLAALLQVTLTKRFENLTKRSFLMLKIGLAFLSSDRVISRVLSRYVAVSMSSN